MRMRTSRGRRRRHLSLARERGRRAERTNARARRRRTSNQSAERTRFKCSASASWWAICGVWVGVHRAGVGGRVRRGARGRRTRGRTRDLSIAGRRDRHQLLDPRDVQAMGADETLLVLAPAVSVTSLAAMLCPDRGGEMRWCVRSTFALVRARDKAPRNLQGRAREGFKARSAMSRLVRHFFQADFGAAGGVRLRVERPTNESDAGEVWFDVAAQSIDATNERGWSVVREQGQRGERMAIASACERPHLEVRISQQKSHHLPSARQSKSPTTDPEKQIR